ncbi:Cellulase (glycosyl hydrolase family 5) [Nonlabens sp. Hel1_33_55]|uniref:glycoside hydrolase family 2 TIM barrel-domain containing protein n=1 Tax=Nonlabens sp. Hel1_33_55 TaxID=1336802 RepID=UPI000875B594|nr:glycoside hydrolase family 2 TIM barrel-domain containing protein [Nonlabens sp. Hel1_33_55]SCX99337.1 Cellulase (glycosyl hydrolase family 5) [Nonlabens sp. Hel1_33_55]
MKKNKALYRILIVAGFLALFSGVLFGISQLLAYLNTGADRSTMLHLDLERENYYVPEVVWKSIENPGRPMKPANKDKIEQDYLDAWFVKNQALLTGDDAGIYDHYTKSARAKVRELISYNAGENISIESTTLSHHLTLDFYSADGTLAVLTDREVRGVEQLYQNDEFIIQREFNNDYRIILLLEDGFWRVRHFELLETHPIEESALVISDEIKNLAGLNYYPQDSPWDTFGENFDSSQIATDFKVIQDLNLNTIRIFLSYKDFKISENSNEKMQRLKILLDQAEKADLKVMVTLFDFYGDYGIQDWTLTNSYLKNIVDHIKDHPAVYAWDIKNEPDLDYKSREKRKVNAWLSQTMTRLKEMDSIHPVTIGWSTAAAAINLENQVDVVSYHYYKDLEDLSKTHQELKSKTKKPIVLQEIGWSSYHGFWNPFGMDKEDQAEKYTEFFTTQKRDSINYLSWTLYDFEEVPSSVAGSRPWRVNKQKHFGLIATDGKKKPSYQSFKDQ